MLVLLFLSPTRSSVCLKPLFNSVLTSGEGLLILEHSESVIEFPRLLGEGQARFV